MQYVTVTIQFRHRLGDKTSLKRSMRVEHASADDLRAPHYSTKDLGKDAKTAMPKIDNPPTSRPGSASLGRRRGAPWHTDPTVLCTVSLVHAVDLEEPIVSRSFLASAATLSIFLPP
jgi:hypothetical protein